MTENPKFTEIQNLISGNDVVLFMKGTHTQPMCGFSALVADLLQRLGVTYKDVNVIADGEMRDAIKQFTDWPTIPQLYVKGEFVGGCDIVKDMFQAGELQALLKEKNIATSQAA